MGQELSEICKEPYLYGLEVVIEAKQLHYHIHQKVWQEGKTVGEFLEVVTGRKELR